jgi:hypothetical protein
LGLSWIWAVSSRESIRKISARTFQWSTYESPSVFLERAIVMRRIEQNSSIDEAYHVGILASSSRLKSRTRLRRWPWPRVYLDNCPEMLTSVRDSATRLRTRNVLFGEIMSVIVKLFSELDKPTAERHRRFCRERAVIRKELWAV